MTSFDRIATIALAPFLVGGLVLVAPAGELVLDMSQIGPVDCGDTFVLAGRTCRLLELDEVRCIGDDYHGMLLMSWVQLVVDLDDLSDVTRVTAVVETVDATENSTMLSVYDGNAAVGIVTNSIYNDPESLVLETAGVAFDSIRLAGVLLLLHEIRIETSGVPVTDVTWSAVKATYR